MQIKANTTITFVDFVLAVALSLQCHYCLAIIPRWLFARIAGWVVREPTNWICNSGICSYNKLHYTQSLIVALGRKQCICFQHNMLA